MLLAHDQVMTPSIPWPKLPNPPSHSCFLCQLATEPIAAPLRPAEPVVCPAAIARSPARCPAVEDSLLALRSVHTPDMDTSTALVLVAVPVAVQGPVRPSGAAVVAGHSLPPQPGTIVPTLPNSPPGSAAAGPALLLAVADCKTAEEHTMQPRPAVEAAALKHMESLVVLESKTAPANLRSHCLRRRWDLRVQKVLGKHSAASETVVVAVAVAVAAAAAVVAAVAGVLVPSSRVAAVCGSCSSHRLLMVIAAKVVAGGTADCDLAAGAPEMRK